MRLEKTTEARQTGRQQPPVVAGYRIDALIGRGAMGSVYRAWQDSLSRWVALKVLDPVLSSDDGFRARFLRESMLAAHVEHPNILTVYDAGVSGELLYISMRYVEGMDLRRLLSEQGLLPVDSVIRIIRQSAAALTAAHTRGLIHRDVKPENILVEGSHSYLADFGIAKQTSAPGLTTTRSFVGTLRYASPEHLRNEDLDARTDVYSLACVAYECLTQVPAFDGDSDYAVMNEHLAGAPKSLRLLRPDLPTSVERVLQKGLARDRNDRYTTATQFAEDLTEALERRVPTERQFVVEAPTLPAGPGARKQSNPAPARRISLGTILVVLLVVGAVAVGASMSLRTIPQSTTSSTAPFVSSAVPTATIPAASGPAQSTSASVPPRTCSFAAFPSQSGTLCDLTASLALGAAPMHVVLSDVMVGNDSTETLTIYQLGPTGAEERLWFGTAKATVGQGGDSFSQLFTFYPAAAQPAQLAYVVAHCGANCGGYDIVVLAVLGGRIQEVLRTSVGKGGGVDWTGDSLLVKSNFYAVNEPLCCPSASREDIYRWGGSSYQFSYAQLSQASTQLNAAGVAPSVVDLFYQFLQRRQFLPAWALFSDEWRLSQSYDDFANGFSQTLTTRFQLGSVQTLSGGAARVRGTVIATESFPNTPSGYVTESTYAGTYDVGYNGKWVITGGNLQLVKRIVVRS